MLPRSQANIVAAINGIVFVVLNYEFIVEFLGDSGEKFKIYTVVIFRAEHLFMTRMYTSGSYN